MTSATRYTGIVVRADPRCSISLVFDDGGGAVTLSRYEANLTNYRLVEGDKIAFSIYRSGSRRYAFDVRLLSPVGKRKPIVPPPPYAALGPCVRVGVRSTGRR